MPDTTPPGWIDVGAADAVTESEPLSTEVDGYPIVIARCGVDLYAVEDRCTHDGESLAGAEVESCEIICPRHASRFSLRTGEALTPPAYEPLRTFNVRLTQGRILVERPD
jgi:3-phenylpropionate/trans-cinnamate dioxygenase ferredoxin component